MNFYTKRPSYSLCSPKDRTKVVWIGYNKMDSFLKDAKLVYDAFAKIKTNLKNICVFHTDRGSEFKNYLIDDFLKEFQIRRSLSAKGCPYDNAVAEAQFKIIKTEFVRSRRFENLEHLKVELMAYVYWFNNKRIHGSLGYKSPVEFRQALI